MTPAHPSGEVTLKAESDIVAARRAVREAASHFGFTPTDVTRIVTAASELARNIFKYAGEGVMRWNYVASNGREGIELQFRDQGPGISDIDLAMEEHYSTSGGLGLGLSGAKRLTDEFEIQSASGQGTIITLRKWRRS